MPNSFLSQYVSQAVRAWEEMDAAQRRLFEIQTGISAPRRRKAARFRSQRRAEVQAKG